MSSHVKIHRNPKQNIYAVHKIKYDIDIFGLIAYQFAKGNQQRGSASHPLQQSLQYSSGQLPTLCMVAMWVTQSHNQQRPSHPYRPIAHNPSPVAHGRLSHHLTALGAVSPSTQVAPSSAALSLSRPIRARWRQRGIAGDQCQGDQEGLPT